MVSQSARRLSAVARPAAAAEAAEEEAEEAEEVAEVAEVAEAEAEAAGQLPERNPSRSHP